MIRSGPDLTGSTTIHDTGKHCVHVHNILKYSQVLRLKHTMIEKSIKLVIKVFREETGGRTSRSASQLLDSDAFLSFYMISNALCYLLFPLSLRISLVQPDRLQI